MTRVLYKEVACKKAMATPCIFKGNVSAKDVSNNLMCLCATSPCVAFVRQWLNHGVLSLVQPADTLLCQRDPAHWHGTLSRTHSLSET
jgi:hypothetical protein